MLTYKDIFNLRGDWYHKAMELCPEARRYEFEIPVKELEVEEGDLVVDIPSGGCYINRYIESVSKPSMILNVEVSKSFIKLCNTKNKLLIESMDSLPLKSESVDKVISIAGLHHIKNKVPVYGEMFRIIRRGGTLVVTDVWFRSKVAYFLNVFVDKYNSQGHKGIFLNKATAHELKSVGFKIEKFRIIKYAWVFRDIESMVLFFKLLFGLNLVKHRKIFSGIKGILGIKRYKNNLLVNWELLLIKAIKP